MNRISAFLLSAALTWTASAASVGAQQDQSPTTRLVPFSGVLTDASGAPLAGPHAVTFTLFDAAEGGVQLWTETQTITSDDRGRYLAYLGSILALPLDIFSTEQARWLQVSVGGRDLPRAMLVSVPYALKAADAETLGGKPLSSFVLTDKDGRRVRGDGTAVDTAAVDGTGVAGQLTKWIGTNTLSSSIITETGTNRIGIATTDPTEGGQLDSRLTIRTNDGTTALAVSNQAGVPRFALNTNADGSWITYDRATGSFEPGIAQRGGRVGISTTDPLGGGVVESKFTVRNLDNNTGIAVLNQADERRFALNTLANGGWQMFDGRDETWNPGLRQERGRIGIGRAPIAAIEVLETGTAEAGFFSISNSSSSQEALVGTTNGTGPGVRANTSHSTGRALQVDVSAATANLIVARRSATNVFRVDGNGNVFAPAYNTGGADFAEAVDAAEALDQYEPGDVMVISERADRTVDRAARPYSHSVIGIYSTQPGIVASPYPVDDPRRAGKLPLAMIGIVPCKVSAENGAIARGDLLVTSATPGHAMKGSDRARMNGAIVGKALQPLASGTGVILVAVTLQ